jgi:SpoVK/Ycf46/Vps4 family AAA+-type ATPase
MRSTANDLRLASAASAEALMLIAAEDRVDVLFVAMEKPNRFTRILLLEMFTEFASRHIFCYRLEGGKLEEKQKCRVG